MVKDESYGEIGGGKKEELDEKGNGTICQDQVKSHLSVAMTGGISGTIAGIVLFVCNRPRISVGQVFRESTVEVRVRQLVAGSGRAENFLAKTSTCF